MMRRFLRMAAIGAFSLLSLWGTAPAQDSTRLVLPSGVFYYVPASTVFGPEAAWINPAGIGHYEANGGELMTDYFDGDYLKSWGGVLNFQSFALAYRSLKQPGQADYHEYLLASGVPVGKAFAIGGSYRYIKSGPDFYRKRYSWTVAVLKQGESPLSWGAVFSNLNRSEWNGRKSAIEQRYSLGYQPLGSKFTLAVDMLFSSGTKWSNADYIYSAEVTPKPGLFIDAYIDSHRNYQFGVRANLLQYFVGSKSTFSRHGDGLGTTTYTGVSSLRQPSLVKDPPKRLSVGLSGALPENPPRPIFGRTEMAYPTTLLSLYRAADDPYIKEVVVYLNQPDLGFARAQEIRDALSVIKSRGKRVVCHVANPGNLSYYVASVADQILIPPVSQLNLVGLRAELTFYAGTMEKLGIKADMVKIGDYKTAAEQYTRSASSEENRQQLNRLLDELSDQFVSGIAEGRHLSADSVRSLIDRGPFTSQEALSSRLVDGLCYADQVDSCLGKFRGISVARYQSDTLANYAWRSKPVLAVVVADGEIKESPTTGFPGAADQVLTPGKLARGFDQASRDSRVAAIVLRIDSPGGEALASDEMFHFGQRSAARKPLVVSMSNTAASGGFYAAMPATRLFASPGTITGSIGIFGGKADFSGLYQKVALGKELYTRGKFAGMMSTIRPFSDDERQKYFSQIKAFYDHFVDLVARNRALRADSVDALGRGQVWTGREARANGLVDEIGGLKQTLDYLAAGSRLKEYRVELYPKSRPLFLFPSRSILGSLVSMFSGKSKAPVSALVDAAQSATESGLYTRMPFDLSIE